jgi:hypothetical protein
MGLASALPSPRRGWGRCPLNLFFLDEFGTGSAYRHGSHFAVVEGGARRGPRPENADQEPYPEGYGKYG